MRRPVIALVLGAVLLAGAAPAGARTSVRHVGGFTAALAGDAVLTGRWNRDHSVSIRRVDPDGSSTRLARIPKATPDSNSVVLTVAASATTWAAAVKWLEVEDGEGGGTYERGELVVRGPLAGGPRTTLMRCKNPGETDDELGLAVAGDDVAWSDAACPGGTGVRLVRAGSTASELVGGGSHVALTAAKLAFHSGNDEVVVVDRVTGARTTIATPAASGFALTDDGVVAAIVNDGTACSSSCPMSAFPIVAGMLRRDRRLAAAPTSVPLAGSAPMVAGGGRVLFERKRGNGLVAVDLATGARSFAGALGFYPEDTVPLAVGATTATYLAPGCDDVLQVRTETTRPSSPERLRANPCPVRVLTRRATVDLRTRTVPLRIRCPGSCATDLELTYRGAFIGGAPVRLAAGETRTIPVDLFTTRALRRRGSIVVRFNETEPRPLAPKDLAGSARLVIG